jgi:hypothetical protein
MMSPMGAAGMMPGFNPLGMAGMAGESQQAGRETGERAGLGSFAGVTAGSSSRGLACSDGGGADQCCAPLLLHCCCCCCPGAGMPGMGGMAGMMPGLPGELLLLLAAGAVLASEPPNPRPLQVHSCCTLPAYVSRACVCPARAMSN